MSEIISTSVLASSLPLDSCLATQSQICPVMLSSSLLVVVGSVSMMVGGCELEKPARSIVLAEACVNSGGIAWSMYSASAAQE